MKKLYLSFLVLSNNFTINYLFYLKAPAQEFDLHENIPRSRIKLRKDHTLHKLRKKNIYNVNVCSVYYFI